MREKTDSTLLNVIQLVNQESSRGTLDLEMIKPYLNDFIRYKKLDEEFHYFREHAREDENSELPFPYLVL